MNRYGAILLVLLTFAGFSLGSARSAPTAQPMAMQYKSEAFVVTKGKTEAVLMKDAMDLMQADMSSMKPSGNADADFAMMMIPHHMGAINMARIELAMGKDAKLRAMAQAIIASQEKEIKTLKAWVAAHPSMKMK